MAATRLTTLPIVFLVAICLLAPFGTARGGNTYWQHDPATPGDWFDPLNWSLNAIPTESDFVYIDNNGTAAVDSGDALANHMYLGYLTGHSGALIQTGGSTKVSTGLYLGYGAGCTGTYELSDTGNLTSSYLFVGYMGGGNFIQSGGVSSESLLYVAYGSQGAYVHSGGQNIVGTLYLADYLLNATGSYDLSGTGVLTAKEEHVGGSGTGTFNHSGGTNTLTGTLYIASPAGPLSTYTLSGSGALAAGAESVGYYGQGALVQTGGTNTISGSLDLGSGTAGSVGTYELSGSGTLSASTEHIGYNGSGTFTQTGGLNTVSALLSIGYYSGSTGTYTLSGTGQLDAQTIRVNDSSSFQQSGGAVAAKVLNVNAGGSYSLSGGALELSRQFTCPGTFDFQDQATALSFPVSGIVDLTNPSGIVNASEASLVAGPNTLIIYEPASPPESLFKGVSSTGVICPSDDIFIPAGRTVIGWYDFTGHPDVQGVLDAVDGPINITGGLTVGPTGRANLGTGTLIVDNDTGMLAGELSADEESIAYSGTVTFTQPGGRNQTQDLYVGYQAMSQGTYDLSGTGVLKAANEYIGGSGIGTFNHAGGTNTTETLRLSSPAGLVSTYTLSDTGTLVAGTEYIGWNSPGTFIQTGGSNTVSEYLDVGYRPHSVGSYVQTGGTNTVAGELRLAYFSYLTAGSYELSGDGSLSAFKEHVGYNGTGTFTQSGGVNKATYLSLGSGPGGQGTYDQSAGRNDVGTLYLGHYSYTVSLGRYQLSGTGSLTAANEYVGDFGTGTFVHSGGTNVVTDGLTLGYQRGSFGTYELSGSGELTADREFIGSKGSGSFNQTGGTNSAQGIVVGVSSTYTLSGGTLSADFEGIGGTFYHNGGTNVITDSLQPSSSSITPGTYDLSGSGQLVAVRVLIGFSSAGLFNQSGGTSNITDYLTLGLNPSANGTYNLSDAGQLSVGGMLQVGRDGTGTFNQSGGSVSALAVEIGTRGSYILAGGSLAISRGIIGEGAIDFQDQSATFSMPVSGILDLWSGKVRNTSGAAFVGGPSSLVVYDPAQPPSTVFNSFSTTGFTLAAGSSVTIPAGRSVLGWGTVPGHVDCQGTLDGSDGNIDVTGGLSVGPSATALLGTGSLTVDDLTSGMSGGQLSCIHEYVGYAGNGHFIQSGGTHTVSHALYLGQQATANGSYSISKGSLSVAELYVGDAGSGALSITDPAADLTVTGLLQFGSKSTLSAVAGSVIQMTGSDFKNLSTTESNLADLSNLALVYESQTKAGAIEVAGMDMGRTAAGFADNFALGGIVLGQDTFVFLRDLYDNGNRNGIGGAHEALYLGKLTLLPGSTLDLNHLHLYVADLEHEGGAIINGDLISLVPGDADGNWRVDSADLAVWQRNYDPLGESVDTFDQGDWDGNGRIDSADLALWQRNYNPLGMMGVSPEVTPEPATLLLVGTGLLTLMGLRRRRGTK